MQAMVHVQSLSRLAADLSVRLAWDGACAVAARHWNVAASDLRRTARGPAQRRHGARFSAGPRPAVPEATARSVAIYLANVVCGVASGRLAREVGITQRGVAKVLRTIEDRREADPAFDRRLDKIELEMMP